MSEERDIMAYRLASRTALVAAVFSAIVCAPLLYDFHRRTMKDPLEHPAYVALRKAVDQQPANKVLLDECRELDEQLREEYNRQKAFSAAGAGLLCLGVIVMLVAAKRAATLRRKLPEPPLLAAPPDLESRWKPWAMASVAVVAMLLAAAAALLGVRRPSWLPAEDDLAVSGPSAVLSPHANPLPPGEKGPREVPAYVASDQDIRTAWPRFRGPDGSGVSPYTNLPDTWDAPANKNILWKTEAPLPGNSSPIVCGQRVFLTGADSSQRQVFCFDAADGRLLWGKNVPSIPASRKAMEMESEWKDYASNTPATDGRRVYAIFANGDLAAFDYGGALVWNKHLGIPKNDYGHAASLVVCHDMLLVPFDQGREIDKLSKLLAYDGATGKLAWQKDRPVSASWSTPLVIRHAGREQIITTSDPWVMAYDPKDGSELWRVGELHYEAAPSPVYAGGLVVAITNEHDNMLAIRPDGHGEVTATAVAWKGEENLPDTVTPVATESALYLLNSVGVLTCYDAHSGQKLWEKDLDKFYALSSPSLVGKRLYLIDKKGKGLVVEVAKDGCKKVGTTNLGEACLASPAFQSGRIYLRGKNHLFCVGATDHRAAGTTSGGLSQFSFDENGTVPFAVGKGDRSMFSDHVAPVDHVISPKNGPVPRP